MLKVRNLKHAYSGGRNVLNNLSFEIGPEEKVALLGPNGAGKSTLLLRLTGAFSGEGEIVVDNLNIKAEGLKELRRRVGMVFQNPDDQLFSPTVHEDVAYGPLAQGLSSSEVDLRVAEALEAVQLSHACDRFPQNLSGGEKKRAALATILVLRPLLMVLDEPVAGLDARARRSVINVLKQRAGAALVATHDLDLASELTERALVLDEGEMVYDGPTDRLLSDEKLLYRHGLKA